MALSAKTKLKSVSKAKPCEICGGDHKCSRGADGLLICGRPPSPEQVPGYVYLGRADGDPQFSLYRRADDPMLRQVSRHPVAAKRSGAGPTTNGHADSEGSSTVVDWEARCLELIGNLSQAHRSELARLLGLPETALDSMRIGNTDSGPHKDQRGESLGPCWTFPEVDAAGKVIGITCRYRDATKRAWPGGKRGLTLPSGWMERQGPVFLVEGASDVLALTALGLSAIGRPNCTGGRDHLKELLHDLPAEREIVVLAEYDAKPDGSWPGRDGAKSLAEYLATELGRPVCWSLPPDGSKDVRKWVISQKPKPKVRAAWSNLGKEFLARAVRNTVKPVEKTSRSEQAGAPQKDRAQQAGRNRPIHWAIARPSLTMPAICSPQRPTATARCAI